MIETALTTESFLPVVHPDASAEAGGRCGDLLLTFQENDGPVPGRHSHNSWKTTLAGDGWQLLHDDIGTSWKGYPVFVGDVYEWNFVLLGELNGPDRKSRDLLESLHSSVSGQKGAEALNGHFLLLAYNQDDRHWHVLTDRFGTFHAYYGSDGRRAAVGTFSPAVASAASRKRLDWEAIEVFFAQGFFPQDQTLLDDVRILKPASHYVFDSQGKMRGQTRYWNWWHECDQKRSYDETVDNFGSIFLEVMQDQTRDGRIALPLSGGLDSRSTAIVAGRGKTNLWAYSYGYTDDSQELSIGRQLANARGLPFQAFTIDPYLFQRLDLVLDSVEGFQDITQCRQAAVIDQIADHADYVIAAHWGDVWMDSMGLAEGDQVRPDRGYWHDDEITNHTLKKVRKRGSEWLLNNVSQNGLNGGNGQERLRDIIYQEIDKLRDIECPDFRVKAFKTDNWSFRWTTGSIRMYQPAAFPRLPFYDTRLADFFCTVPSRFLRGRRLQVDYLKRYAPDLARITWQAHDTNLFDYQKNSRVLPKRAARKAWRLLTRKKPIERNWEVQLLNSAGRMGLDAWLMRPGLRLHEFVSPEKVKGLLDQFFVDPNFEKRGYSVSMLLTFSTWLEKYG